MVVDADEAEAALLFERQRANTEDGERVGFGDLQRGTNGQFRRVATLKLARLNSGK